MEPMDNQLLVVENLRKLFPLRKGVLASFLGGEQKFVHAVDGVSFSIGRGEIFCLVGESGCGKTTTGRLVLRLETPTSGRVIFDGNDLASLPEKALQAFRRRMQIIFQDPYSALNPRKTVYKIVSEPLEIHDVQDGGSDRSGRVRETLELVDLTPPENFILKYPHELSGGQRQRVAVARALILKPDFIVADEPVSMVDVSMRVGILNLLQELRNKFNLAFLFITHDLGIARYISDRIGVMYLGKIVEIGETENLIRDPQHPYTAALMSAAPKVFEEKETRATLKGEVPNPIDIPPGCRFSPRCPQAAERCRTEEPQLFLTESKRLVACHLAHR